MPCVCTPKMVKTELAKFKDDCQRFFGETSTHALGQVADDESPIGDNHPVRRGCWLVVWVFCITVLIIFGLDRISYYKEYPVATATSVKNDEAKFPRVTFCSVNPISVAKLRAGGLRRKPLQQYDASDANKYGFSFTELVKDCKYSTGGVTRSCMRKDPRYCYDFHKYFAVPGMNLRTVPARTPEQCQAICSVDPKCLVVDYATTRGAYDDERPGIYRTGACILNGGFNIPANLIIKSYEKSAGYKNLDCYIKRNCTAQETAANKPIAGTPQWEKSLHPVYGKCFSFNPGNIHPQEVGHDGISMIFNTFPLDTQSGDSGVVILPHDETVAPNMFSASRISPGFGTALTMTRKMVARIPNTGGKTFHKHACITINKDYGPYSEDRCKRKCHEKKMAAQCGCAEGFVEGLPSCFSSKLRKRTVLPRSCSGSDKLVPNCDKKARKKCCPMKSIGDGSPDCSFLARPKTWTGCDLSCYDSDGGDCGVLENECVDKYDRKFKKECFDECKAPVCKTIEYVVKAESSPWPPITYPRVRVGGYLRCAAEVTKKMYDAMRPTMSGDSRSCKSILGKHFERMIGRTGAAAKRLPAYPCIDAAGTDSITGRDGKPLTPALTCRNVMRGQKYNKLCTTDRNVAFKCQASCGFCVCRNDDDAGTRCDQFKSFPARCTQSPFAADSRKCPRSCGACGFCNAGIRDFLTEYAGIATMGEKCIAPADESGWISPADNVSKCSDYSLDIDETSMNWALPHWLQSTYRKNSHCLDESLGQTVASNRTLSQCQDDCARNPKCKFLSWDGKTGQFFNTCKKWYPYRGYTVYTKPPGKWVDSNGRRRQQSCSTPSNNTWLLPVSCRATNNAKSDNCMNAIDGNTTTSFLMGWAGDALVNKGEEGTFTAKLAAKNGVNAASYTFRKSTSSTRSGSYSSIMVQECKKYGMKPVCNHPAYCKDDAKALYIGQTGHIAHPPDRNDNNKFPSGWSGIKSNWNGLCTYINTARGNYAMCNTPTNSYSWRSADQYNPGFICGTKPGDGRNRCNPSSKCGECEGDCDQDSDCKTGLVCFQRNGKTKVPGCGGGGGAHDVSGQDYCARANWKQGRRTGRLVFDMKCPRRVAAVLIYNHPQAGKNGVKDFLIEKSDGSYTTIVKSSLPPSSSSSGHIRINFANPTTSRFFALNVQSNHGDWYTAVQSVKFLFATPSTKSPTNRPTNRPTMKPTGSPSTAPTANPTASPTTSPTSAPSTAPTANPTASPTTSPTSAPSRHGCEQVSPKDKKLIHACYKGKGGLCERDSTKFNAQTKTWGWKCACSPGYMCTAGCDKDHKGHTCKLTSSPTASPSTSPTTEPTTSPTTFPTRSPTVSPTSSPTVSPTVSPTASPSVSPTVSPSASPTVSPTASPSVSPTVSPTASPTTSPTMSPKLGKRGKWNKFCKEDGADLHCWKACNTCTRYVDEQVKTVVQSRRIAEFLELLRGNLGGKFTLEDSIANPSILTYLDQACDQLKPKNLVDKNTPQWLKDYLLKEAAEQAGYLAKVTIAFAEFPVEKITESEAYSFVSMVAELGGTSGLAAGLSMITFLEFGEFFAMMLFAFLILPAYHHYHGTHPSDMVGITERPKRPWLGSLHGPAAAVNTFMHGKAAADDDATPDLESRVGDEPGDDNLMDNPLASEGLSASQFIAASEADTPTRTTDT